MKLAPLNYEAHDLIGDLADEGKEQLMSADDYLQPHRLEEESAKKVFIHVTVFGPPFSIKGGPYAALLSVCLSSVCL